MRLVRAAVLKVRALILAGLSVESAPRRRGNFLYDLIIFFFKYRVIYISLFLTGECQYLIKSKLMLEFGIQKNFHSRNQSLASQVYPKTIYLAFATLKPNQYSKRILHLTQFILYREKVGRTSAPKTREISSRVYDPGWGKADARWKAGFNERWNRSGFFYRRFVRILSECGSDSKVKEVREKKVPLNCSDHKNIWCVYLPI